MRTPTHFPTQQTSVSADDSCACTYRNLNRASSTHEGQRTKTHWTTATPRSTQGSVYRGVVLIAHSCHQLDKWALVVHFLPTAYERQIRLVANKMTANGTATASMIPVHSPSSESRVTTSAEMALHLHLIPVSLHPGYASKFETCRVLLAIFEPRERRVCHDRSIPMMKMIKLLIQMLQHLPIVHQTQWTVWRSWNLKSILNTTSLRHERNTSRNEFSSRDSADRNSILGLQDDCQYL